MPACLPISVGLMIAIVVGVQLMLFGRQRYMRRIGAIMSSALGPCIIWLTGRLLMMILNNRLFLYTPSYEDILIIGQDITLWELLWVPVMDAGSFIVIGVVFAGVVLFWPRKISPDAALLLPSLPTEKWLDKKRKLGKRGRQVYFGISLAAALLALPAIGLGSYVTLQLLLMKNKPFLIENWIDWSVFGTGAIFALVYYIVNSVIALQD